jgi:[ribosomal protein S5]-alanine N-acetyltransferase
MKSFQESPTLIGKRVTLRNINPDIDNQQFYKIFLEPDMHLWTGNKLPKDEFETYQILSKYRDLDEVIAWSIISNETQNFIGTYWIAPNQFEGRRIVTEAQRIGKNCWRKGYTRDARKLIYDFVFFELDIDEVHAGAWKDNVNSSKSMENIGFKLFKSERKLFVKRNEELIENHYILTKQNWIMKRENI